MSITNDDMQRFMEEARQFAEAHENGDSDTVFRLGKHLANKLNLLADNAIKRKRRTSRLRPQATFVGQVGKFKTSLHPRSQPLNDTKWVEASPEEVPALTPEQADEIRRKYNIRDSTDDDPTVDYGNEFVGNETPSDKRVRKE